jgi:hypothetical protein
MRDIFEETETETRKEPLMIRQILDVKTKTESLPNLNAALIQARHVQARIQEQIADGLLPKNRWRFLEDFT